ncbi:MAG: uroporphyrinogen-III synthase [Hyphomonadaceae bacterium]|nr:uroporphyrinogen-III synthase [Hyphomonadaceae bacterium]
MSLRIAITRALPDAERTASAIRARGGEPVIAPLLSIEARAFDTNLDGVQALLFTSAAGVRAFAEASGERARPVLCVGDATAETARAGGFLDVRSADGDAQALAALAAQSLDPRAGKLLHVSGADIASDMIGPLRAAGFSAERRIAYEAAAAASLPPAFGGPLDVVLFYSARAARTFVALDAPGAGALTAGCMSPNVAKAAEPERWKRVIIASSPREDALLAAIFPA